jgi:aminopeptidase N
MCDVLTDETKTLTLAGGCAPWVFANAGAHGYYRTAYAPEMLRAIAPHVETDLSAPERMTLLDDEWALVRAGRHTSGDYLTLAAGFGREHVSGVLGDLTGRLGFVRDRLTTSATRAPFEAFTRTLLRPLFDEVGFTGSGTEPDDRRALRGVLIGALGVVGQDPDVIARSRAALDRALAGGPSLEPSSAGAIVRTAATHGDAKLFDALAAAAERANSPDEMYRYLFALSDFSDPALADRGLERTLTPQIRTQDAALYLSGFIVNDATRPRAWTFVQQHWAALEPKVNFVGSDVNLVRSLGTFCDAQSRDEVAAFFKAHPLPGAVRTVTQTIEQINSCIALKEKQTPSVTTWISAR